MAGVYPTISVFVSAMQDLFCATADATLVFLLAYKMTLYTSWTQMYCEPGLKFISSYFYILITAFITHINWQLAVFSLVIIK